MGNYKRRAYSKELSKQEVSNYIGSKSEYIRNSETNNLVLMDGVTPGGFEIDYSGNLTIENIINIVNDLIINKQSAQRIVTKSGIHPGVEKFNDSERDDDTIDLEVNKNGVVGYEFKDKDSGSVWNNYILSRDYVEGTGINFFIDWVTDKDEEGEIKFGVQCTVIENNANNQVLANKIFTITNVVYKGDEEHHRTSLDQANLITSAMFKKNVTLNVTFFRINDHNNSNYKKYKEDILVLNAGIEYIESI